MRFSVTPQTFVRIFHLMVVIYQNCFYINNNFKMVWEQRLRVYVYNNMHQAGAERSNYVIIGANKLTSA